MWLSFRAQSQVQWQRKLIQHVAVVQATQSSSLVPKYAFKDDSPRCRTSKFEKGTNTVNVTNRNPSFELTVRTAVTSSPMISGSEHMAHTCCISRVTSSSPYLHKCGSMHTQYEFGDAQPLCSSWQCDPHNHWAGWGAHHCTCERQGNWYQTSIG
jgi:hypothetical protein